MIIGVVYIFRTALNVLTEGKSSFLPFQEGNKSKRETNDNKKSKMKKVRNVKNL